MLDGDLSAITDMIDEETLNTPVEMEEVDEFGCSMLNAMHDAETFYVRLQRQYGGNTWISDEVWAVACILHQAYDRMQELVDQDVFETMSDRMNREKEEEARAQQQQHYGQQYYTPY